MDKILTIIPARKNSKRLLGKNTKIFNGLPLVEHSIKLANELPDEFEVIVSTDDYSIKQIVDKYDKLKFSLRPEDLAEDDSPAIDYVKYTLSQFPGNYSAVLILQATSPFTQMIDIIASVELFKKKRPATVVSVVKVSHMYHPDKFKIFEEDYILNSYFDKETETAYQNMSEVFVRNCSIYLTDIDVITNSNKIISDPCLGYEMPANRSIDINDQLDFEFAEFLAAKDSHV